jgi:predicted translin family RNA/ssDNA-binding protein
MATSKQEQLYNEIVEYYAFADRMIRAVQEGSHNLAEQEFAIIEETTSKLEDYADQLATQYISFVTTGESEKTIANIRAALNNIASKIEECRHKISMLKHNE